MGRYYDPAEVRKELDKLIQDPAERVRLLHAAERPFKQYTNIVVVYPGLVEWLEVYSRGRKLADEIESYKAMKNDHEVSVTKQMKRIAQRVSGSALLSEIQSASFRVRIFPYDWSEGVLNAVAHGFARGRSGGGPALIEYSAHMWGPDAPKRIWTPTEGVFRLHGPAWDADAALFHELNHSARQLKGLKPSTPVNQNFGNQEEFLAVVVTNIYLSEKGEWLLRGNAGPSNALLTPAGFESFLDDQRIRPSPRELLDYLRTWQPTFWKSLAAIGPGLARFNPIRQYDTELTATTRRGTPGHRTTSRSTRPASGAGHRT